MLKVDETYNDPTVKWNPADNLPIAYAMNMEEAVMIV